VEKVPFLLIRFQGTCPRIFVIACIILAALIAEFFILEGTIGISVPSDRNSALSTLEIRDQGRELHFITLNKRFTVVFLDGSRHSS
jgi:hypothetical protein